MLIPPSFLGKFLDLKRWCYRGSVNEGGPPPARRGGPLNFLAWRYIFSQTDILHGPSRLAGGGPPLFTEPR